MSLQCLISSRCLTGAATLFISSLLLSTSLTASGFAPDDILRVSASVNITSAAFPDDLGPDTISATQSDFSSGTYAYVKLSTDTARVTYDDGDYSGTILLTFTTVTSGTFRDDFTGVESGFTAGTFTISDWFPIFHVEEDTWYSEAGTLDQGWRFFSWFKSFIPLPESDWIFHSRHRFVYVVGVSPNSLFLWDNAMQQWLYTNQTVYPWMYSFGPNPGWVFFFQNSQPGSRFFARGDTGQVITEAVLASGAPSPGEPEFGTDSGTWSFFQSGTFGVFRNGVEQERLRVELTQDTELSWNNQIVKTSRYDVADGDTIVWCARSTDGGIYRLREEEPNEFEEDIFIPAMLLKPGTPTAGQTWSYSSANIERNFRVISINATSPNGINGCVVIEEVRPGSFTDTWYFKDDTAVALMEEEFGEAGSNVIYRVGD